jgi:hypothetical protein
MDAKFREILDALPNKPPRSRLEPYRELIEELRRRGRTYVDIAGILAEKCQVQVTASGVHDFVRTRSRMKRRSTKQIASDPPKTTPPSNGTGRVDSTQKPLADDEVRRRIAALKARKPVVEAEPNGFQFDPTEPLRLITPVKPTPDK